MIVSVGKTHKHKEIQIVFTEGENPITQRGKNL